MKLFLAALCLAASVAGQAADLLEQANAAFREGDFEKAAALARRVLARDAGAAGAHMVLGVIAAQKNDWKSSDLHFKTLVRLEPGNPYGYFYLGQAALYQQRWAEAIQYFSKALERQYPDRERLLIEMSLAQNEAGEPHWALETLSSFSPTSPQSSQYYAVKAFALDKLGQQAQAIGAMQETLKADDSRADYWEFLIGALIRSDRAPQALAEAIRAQRKFPDNPDIQYLFALASYYVNESPLSHVALRNLREASPEDPRVQLAEGLLYRKQGDTGRATEAFQKAASRNVPDARLLLCIIYRENGDLTAAEGECREAERLNPQSGQVMLELGKLLLARGALPDARVRLEKAVQLMPDAAAAHYQLGLVYRRMGLNEKAQEQLKLAR
jgi:Flp pilus assembly protein TadD